MANTTFSGPVKSQRGFELQDYYGSSKHHSRNYFNFCCSCGKVIKVNDADGVQSLTGKADSS